MIWLTSVQQVPASCGGLTHLRLSGPIWEALEEPTGTYFWHDWRIFAKQLASTNLRRQFGILWRRYNHVLWWRTFRQQ